MKLSDLPDLTGTRVILRRPSPADVAVKLRLGRDPEIIRMYGGGTRELQPLTLADAERFVAWCGGHEHLWVIDDGGYIGHVRLDRIDLSDRRASLAIGIDDPGKLGKGLGTEALRLVLGHAFASMRLHRIGVRVLACNRRAIRAYEKCGFVVEGREREAALVDDQWHDDVMMGILDREFHAMPSTVPDQPSAT